ncbi:hypothetical protein N2152v2_009009 [Parachlorella kessleri]
MTIHNDAVVRLAQPSDCATIADYNCRIAKETEDLELDKDTVVAGVGAILQDPSKGRYYVVEVGGHDAPVAQLMITLEWSDWRNAQVWWVQSVYVHPEHRRRGYYRLLYQHVREAAKHEGVAGIRLYADTGNAKAHSTDIQSRGVNAAVLTYIANSLFAVYLPIYWVNLRLRERVAARRRASQEEAALVPAGSNPSDAMVQPLAAQSSKDLPDMTWRQLLRSALLVGPLWYLAQLTFNLSLAHTSVTSNTVLSSTSSLFTFLISVWVLHEVFNVKKLLCILLLIAGTAVYTLADTTSSGDGARGTFWGDMLVLVSAVLYAAYTVAIRKALSDDEHVSMALFFGLTGSVIFLGLGPLLLLLWLAGVGLGTFTWKTFGLVVAKGLLDNVLSDYLWARAILLIGPTVATAGLSMQIPFAVLLDVLFRSPAWLSRALPAVLTFTGGGLILAGFLGINLSSEEEAKDQAAQDELHEVASHCELEGLAEPYERGEGEGAPLQLPLPREGPVLERSLPGYHEKP